MASNMPPRCQKTAPKRLQVALPSNVYGETGPRTPRCLAQLPLPQGDMQEQPAAKKHPSQTSEDLASPPPRAPVFNVHMHARPAVCKSGRLFRNGSHSPGSTAPNFEIGARGCHRFDARSRSAFLFSETTVPPTPVGLLGAPKDSRSTPRRFARYTHRRDKSANVRMHRGRAPARV